MASPQTEPQTSHDRTLEWLREQQGTRAGSRRNTGGLWIVLGAGAILASVAFPPARSGTYPAQAQACGSITPCPDAFGTPDSTKLSSVDVQYVLQSDTSTKFEPNAVTSWDIWAKYLSPSGSACDECDDWGSSDAVATLNVTWNEGLGRYVVVPTFVTPPFRSITLCASKTCNPGAVGIHSWGYTILVELDQAVFEECPGEGTVAYYLDQVLYTTTAVPNATRLSGCAHHGVYTNVAPNSQTYQVGDNGDWECVAATNVCVSGPSLNITY